MSKDFRAVSQSSLQSKCVCNVPALAQDSDYKSTITLLVLNMASKSIAVGKAVAELWLCQHYYESALFKAVAAVDQVGAVIS
jgi:hypothetical protein